MWFEALFLVLVAIFFFILIARPWLVVLKQAAWDGMTFGESWEDHSTDNMGMRLLMGLLVAALWLSLVISSSF